MTQYVTPYKPARSPVNSVMNAIAILNISSTDAKLCLADVVDADRSTPIPVFVMQMDVLRKYGLIEKTGRKSRKTDEWILSPIGKKILTEYETISQLLCQRK